MELDEGAEPSVPPLLELERSPTGRFSKLSQEIGCGAFKIVSRGFDRESGLEVAWNVLRIANLSPDESKLIWKEIEVMKEVRHENILRCIASWVNQQHKEVVFITELMPGGSLKSFIQKMKHPHVRVIKKWARDILSGLSYLHSHEPPIIHRDIKPDNIFIDDDDSSIKLGDFGLCSVMSGTHKSSMRGTPAYMAPELFESCYGPTVDVYGLGMCLLEIATLQRPYSECFNMFQVYSRASKGVKPQCIDAVSCPELKKFILLTLEPKERRPTAAALLHHPFLAKTEEFEIDKHFSLLSDVIHHVEIKVRLISADNVSVAQKIEFNFDHTRDTPRRIAIELVQVLDLAEDQVDLLEALISEKVDARTPASECSSPASKDGFLEFPGVLSRYTVHTKADAKLLQNALRQVLGVEIESTGVIGPVTEYYIKEFQKRRGWPRDGVVTEGVWTDLVTCWKREVDSCHDTSAEDCLGFV